MKFMPLRGALLVAAALIVEAPGQGLAWSPKQPPLMTRWAKDVDPDKTLPDYPRPQMVRADWLNLNGVWEFKRGAEDDALSASDAKLPEEILVPFPMESALSGVMDHAARVWYRRHFTVPAAWKGKRVLLHFGAVDYESEVFVNGKSVGVHKGGYNPFSYDVTPLLSGRGPQELVVRVFDPTDDQGQPRGKQTLHPRSIMYTSTTGIWQTVWLEPVDQLYIDNLKIVPDVDGGMVKITVNASGVTANTAGVTVSVFDPEKKAAARTAGDPKLAVRLLTGTGAAGIANTELSIPVPDAKLWSPDRPFLYTIEVTLSNGREIVDSVHSYFGMRKISLGDDKGVKKMLLNNQFVFENGPLDQGFWPDGIYTAPTEAAMKNDLEMMKAFGFNMVRKHLKVEPARWYYWCDKLGLLVWQDMPSGNSYAGSVGTPPIDSAAFDAQLKEMVVALGNTPSIIMWEIFNEGQGRHDAPELIDLVRKLDPSRLVNEDSGDTLTDRGDVFDIHPYPAPKCPPPHATQALVAGEYGGLGLNVPGHTWTGTGKGYAEEPDPEALRDQYSEYAGTIRKFRDEQGLSAVVYTQLTDVETELNGLLTYDRIPKVDPASLAPATRLEYKPATYKTVVPASDAEAQTWKYTTDQPAQDWSNKDFNDAVWTEGKAGFGKQGPYGNTPWTTSDIWLRRHFNPGNLSADDLKHLVFRMFHDDDAQVFINGVPAYDHGGFISEYQFFGIKRPAALAIVPGGDNVLAVHCLQKTGGQYIDVGMSQRLPMEK